MADQAYKHHSACDECRRRKLKCSGDPSGCARCSREGLTCIYSVQKRMGRPKKRMHGDVHVEDNGSSPDPSRLKEAGTFQTPPSSTDVTSQQPVGTDQTWAPDPVNDDGLFDFDSFSASFGLDNLPNAVGLSKEASEIQQEFQGLLNADAQPNALPIASPYGPGAPGLTGACMCMNNMYMASHDIQANYNGPEFQSLLGALRLGMLKAKDMITCGECFKQPHTARHNTLLVTSLLSYIASSFDKLLRDVDSEASRANSAGEVKIFRTGAPVTLATAHLHTGTTDCPMAVKIELSPQEWRTASFKAIRQSINDRGNGEVSLEGMATALENRQKQWHSSEYCPSMFRADPTEDRFMACVQLARSLKTMIRTMPL